MLVCGDCPYRDGVTCKHPDLKANGGPGLEVKIGTFPAMDIHVSFTDGSGGWLRSNKPITRCMGKKE
jgi:hypothetical protein